MTVDRPKLDSQTRAQLMAAKARAQTCSKRDEARLSKTLRAWIDKPQPHRANPSK